MLTFHYSLHLCAHRQETILLFGFCLSLTWGHCFLALAMVTCQLVCGESKHDSACAVSRHSLAPLGTFMV